MLRVRRKETGLKFRRILCVALLLPCAQAQARSQTSSPAGTGQSKSIRHKDSKKVLEAQTFVLVGAGDIASCKNPEGARATAKLIEQIPGAVFAAGDLAYEKGSAADF